MNTRPDFTVNEIDDNDSTPYLVLFAATESHAQMSTRLAESVRNFGLPFISLRVPVIHRSVNPTATGTDDPNYTKASLISAVMDEVKRPILYLDCDLIVEERPFLIEYLCAEHYDFGVFNWLSPTSNQAYRALNSPVPASPIYGFSHSVDYVSRTQLICSGAVQFWNNTPKSRELMGLWQDCVANNPQCCDDPSLDYAFNNMPSAEDVKSYWLPRSYTRYVWWVLDTPVINHPDLPNPGRGFVELNEFRGRPRFHVDQLSPRILTKREMTLRNNRFRVRPGGTADIL